MSRSIAKNFAYNTSYQLLKILTPLITTPYIARVLGAELVGTFSYTQSITTYFVMFGALGMSTYGVRTIATCKDREERSRTFWAVYASQLVVCALMVAAYLVYLALQGGDALVYALAWTPYVVSAVLDVSWLFFGVEDFKLTAMRSMIIKVVELVGILTLVRSHDDLVVYILLVALEYLADQVAVWPFVRQFVDWARPTWGQVRRHFVPNLRLFLPVIATSLYSQMDNIILGTLSTMRETGYYQYAYKLTTFPLSAITAMGTVMLPHMSSAFASGDREAGLRYVRWSLWLMLAMAFAFMWGIIGVANVFVPVFLGGDFIPAIPTVVLLTVTVPLISITNVLGVQYLLPSFRDTQFTVSVFVGAAVNLAVTFLLVGRMGALGSAVGTVAAELAVLVYQAHLVRDELPLGLYARDALPFCLIGLVMTVLLRLVEPLLVAGMGTGVITLLVEILLGAVSFASLAFAWCTLTHCELFEAVVVPRLRRLRKRVGR